MKLILCLTLILLIIPTNKNVLAKQNNTSYCVMCMNDNNIIQSHNREYTQNVASISKIMTAILAIELGDLQDVITIDSIIYAAVGSSVYLKENEQYTLEDLLYALLLRSGNDAALVIAQHIGGNVESFVEIMNEKAKELKMYQTIFNNPSGLDEYDEGNISSSCDIALLTSYAMKNKVFKTIVKTKIYSPKEGISWKNKNRFLFEYKYATGGKTGYTKKAGRTLVTTSKQEEMEIAVVSLNMNDDFNVHKVFHDESYEKFEVHKLIEKGIYKYKNYRFHIQEPFYQLVYKSPSQNIQIHTKLNRKELQVISVFESFKNMKSYEVKYE